MNKLLAVAAVGLFAASSAIAGEGVKSAAGYGGGCGYGAVAETKAPITTALKSGPVTVKPTKSTTSKDGG